MLCLRLQFNGWMVLSVPIGQWKQKQSSQRFQKPNRCTLMLMLDNKPVGWGKPKRAPIDLSGMPIADLEAKMGNIQARL